jgi:hypothetical protein
MARSSILITFTTVPNPDEAIVFQESLLNVDFFQTFKSSRLAARQTKIPLYKPSLDEYLGFISENYKAALNLDVNSSGLFTIVSTNGYAGSGIGTVLITANFPNAVFVEDVNTTTASITIVNEASVPAFSFTDISFSEASYDPQHKCKINITTNHLATNILSPIVASNSNNPLSADYLRKTTFNLKLRDANGIIIERFITFPDYLVAENFTLNINNSPTGATVTIEKVNSEGLELQYSLDNENWQTENVFSSLGVDSYILYIKDQLGWQVTKEFVVNEFAINSPFFYISKSNSIRYAQRVAFGDAANYKKDENTLSCEVLSKIPYKELQLFQSADVVTNQFKSNYETNTVKVIKSDATEDIISVEKKTSNIGNKDKRDAIKFNYGNGKTGIYFQSGNIYDYATDEVIGTFALNGYLPFWASSGNYVQIGLSWFLIEDVIFDESRNCEAIIISSEYTGVDADIIVASIFNYKNYEVYEFAIDMLDYLDQDIRVKIEATDDNFSTITYLSELINVKVKQENTLEIRYKNSDNTDIYYQTGIEFKLRQEYQKISGFTEQKSEDYRTDTNAVLLNADMYEGDEFLFEPVTKGMMHTILRALSHESVFINEVGYVKTDAIDVEGPLEDSNLYVIKAKMLKNGNVYNSQANGNGNQIYNGENVEIPGLVDYGGGFVRY